MHILWILYKENWKHIQGLHSDVSKRKHWESARYEEGADSTWKDWVWAVTAQWRTRTNSQVVLLDCNTKGNQEHKVNSSINRPRCYYKLELIWIQSRERCSEDIPNHDSLNFLPDGHSGLAGKSKLCWIFHVELWKTLWKSTALIKWKSNSLWWFWGYSLFFQFYWDITDIQRCINLKCTVWFNLYTPWKDYHNKVSEHPSFHIDTKF